MLFLPGRRVTGARALEGLALRVACKWRSSPGFVNFKKQNRWIIMCKPGERWPIFAVSFKKSCAHIFFFSLSIHVSDEDGNYSCREFSYGRQKKFERKKWPVVTADFKIPGTHTVFSIEIGLSHCPQRFEYGACRSLKLFTFSLLPIFVKVLIFIFTTNCGMHYIFCWTKNLFFLFYLLCIKKSDKTKEESNSGDLPKISNPLMSEEW